MCAISFKLDQLIAAYQRGNYNQKMLKEFAHTPKTRKELRESDFYLSDNFF